MIKIVLSSLMEKNKLAISDLARATNIDRGTLTRMCNHSIVRIDLKVIDTLCTYFDLPPSELFVWDGGSKTKEETVLGRNIKAPNNSLKKQKKKSIDSIASTSKSNDKSNVKENLKNKGLRVVIPVQTEINPELENVDLVLNEAGNSQITLPSDTTTKDTPNVASSTAVDDDGHANSVPVPTPQKSRFSKIAYKIKSNK